jgi:hypothetical protein
VEVKCSGVFVDEFSGGLTPEFVNSSPSFAEFGSGSGSLQDSGHRVVTVSGKDTYEGPGGEVILATNP